MNVQIKSLVVQECGPLRDVEISFTNSDGNPRPVTVIGGTNGSGKTTILELIFALMQIMLPEFSADSVFEFPILERTKKARVHLLLDGETVNVTFGHLRNAFDYSRPESPSIKALWAAVRDDNSTAFLPFGASLSARQTPSKSPGTGMGQGKKLAPSILYFPYYRRIVPTQGKGLSREKIAYQWAYRYETVQSFQGSLNAYLVWLEYAHAVNFEIAKRFLNETVLEDKTIAYVDRPNLQTMVELSGGVTHTLDELSSGEQNLLIIMLELWRRLLPGSIVLIDEIENSLHPAFQHRLAEALLKLQARIPFQLIVTTHAPAFLDAFGPDSALILTEF